MVIDFVHEVCKKWKDDLPELSPPHHVLYSCSHEIKNTRRKMEDRHVSLPDMNTLFELKVSTYQTYRYNLLFYICIYSSYLGALIFVYIPPTKEHIHRRNITFHCPVTSDKN